ncbi:hemolysin family protein [Halostagnicola kamekurae]|uniref:Hemolysin, contains CBS domains n=1 Tax=Halostagnicola kamekurae TaxID=619731 RepID=A0A1I6TM61_9EURY|nr:hemolysin family protein [Halostagnicola kamekurae]SFS90254.1 Hemolysin, contains CBS domains [Halostagnicola kamekurae]
MTPIQHLLVAGISVNQDMLTLIGSVALLVLLGLSAFFSSSELAMFSLARHRIDALQEEGAQGAQTLAELKADPHRLLVTILVGNNLVNIAMSSIATALVGFYFDPGPAVLVSTFGVTAVVLLFGESGPKSYAVENTESWALKTASPLKVSQAVLFPLVVVFDYLTRLVNRVTGGQSSIEDSYVSRDEIQDIIETGEREGVLEEGEKEMLQRILRFNNTIAKEVMTPRLDVEAIAKSVSIEEAIQACVQSGHERLPVYEASLDNVIGVVSIRDLVREHLYGEGSDVELTDLVQPTLHVPESKNVDELLGEMQSERVHLAVVLDEFGTTEGILTTEDITEAVVGELLEEEEEHPVEFVDDDTVIVRGEVNIDEVNEALDIELPEGEEFETIAGFIFNRSGRLVEDGEVFVHDDIEIRIEQVENTRITRSRIRKIEDDETGDGSEAAGDAEQEAVSGEAES